MFRLNTNLGEMSHFFDKSTRIYTKINKKDKNRGCFGN